MAAPGRRRPRRPRLTVAVLLLLGAAACTEDPVPVPAPPLTGVFEQGRSQVEERTAKAVITVPEGADPVEVTGLELLLPGFTGPGAKARTTTLEPGRTVALEGAYGEATCAGDPQRQQVQVRIAVAGREDPVLVTLDDPDARAGRILQRECAAQRVAALAPLTWQPGWTTRGTGGDLVAVGHLDVGPVTGTEPVTVEGIGATPLFSYAATAAPLTVAPGERASVAVHVTPTRCDPHAVAEDKLGFAPTVTLRVGQEVLTAAVWVPREQRAVPLAALAERCAAG